jgi:hypothetical protein
MEGGIVLSHELIELNIFVVLPPFPVIIILSAEIVSSNGNIANWCIEPNIEDFFFEPFLWDWASPHEVTSDAPCYESTVDEMIGKVLSVSAPIRRSFVNPCLQILRDFWEIDEDMV